ncbi:uncharacterized protein B0H18DRAFT_1116491 [Fomitopsis serialis]|uniref:uncharacterized protein n=1 Tax=Fomitopsis serialis TaxID=139415 RepID=UPI0020072668|nr:uncharacterized protein B0H18DRAFT_1116491 [Neoantrodia serialis]KAH9931334.1 hypothetical protein B0H18DRAFT_1116491 [Neoantrodia serialis]
MNYYSTDLYYAGRDDGSYYDQQQGPGRVDRDTSLTEPDANAASYTGGYKDDPDVADDPHLALTSQTLNADGTPKRPMNAFMIFARKRRPEISAANQMMRTGDVSKILSREWNTMEMPEKKFYLDQAKKLKDHFNSRYPDYVYRRRPNNSRKKRKPDVGHEASAEGSSSVEREDLGTDDAHELDEVVEEAALHDYHYQFAQTSGAPSQMTYGNAAQSHSLSGYNAPSSPFSSNRYDDKSASLSHSRYSSSTSPPLTAGMLASHHAGELNASNAWPYHRDGTRTGRVPLLPALDTGLARQRTSESDLAASMRAEATSPQTGVRTWGSGPYSTSSGSSSASMTHHSNSAFPTLTSPFIPAPSPSPRQVDPLSSPMSHYSATQDYSSGQSVYAPRGAPSSGRSDGAFEHRGFTQTNVLPPPVANTYLPPADQLGASWSSQYRSFPPSHTNFSPSTLSMPSLPMQGSSPTAPSPTNPNAMSSSLPHMGYVDRNRFEGR